MEFTSDKLEAPEAGEVLLTFLRTAALDHRRSATSDQLAAVKPLPVT
jgi:hypothetical protein